MPTSLLSASSLTWLGLLAPLVLLYVLKRRREERRVGSTLLWELAMRDMRAERPWQRLIPQVSLFLQALVLIFGAIALARPAGAGQVPSGARVAVVVDTSASMATREDGGTRLELARRAALGIARTLPPGGEMMLVAGSADPVVLVPSSHDLAALEHAIDDLRETGGAAAIDRAVALAAERLREAPAGSRIVVLTDGALDGTIRLESPVPVEVQAVGTAHANDAIIAVDVRPRPSVDAPDRAEIFARVARFADDDHDLWVTASIEGRGIVASRRVHVAHEHPSSVVLSAELPPDANASAAVVVVELSSTDPSAGATDGAGDALALDDLVVAPSPAARQLPVFLVGAAPSSLRRVLLADADVELFATSLAGLAERRARDPDAPDLDGVFVFVGAAPDEAPAGDSIVIAPTSASVFGATLGAESRDARVVSWDEGDPVLRFVRFRDLHVAAFRPITGASARPLLAVAGGTAIASLTRPDAEITLVGFDPDRSDWPDQPSFVIFFRNVLERARERRAEGGIHAGRLGEPLRVPAPDGSTVVVRAPDGRSETALSRGGVAIAPTHAVPGVYTAEVGRRHLHALRNLLDPAESDIRPRARFETGTAGGTVSTSEAHEPREAWPWLAGALLVVLALETLWATRRNAT